jgi:hypothetical protein
LTLWGVVTTSQGKPRYYLILRCTYLPKGTVTSYEGLLFARFFLGLLEGK